MLKIGLCGGSGSGKTLAQGLFAANGIPGLDTDILYHDMISADTPLSRALVLRFGDGIRMPDGSVDRARLSKIVFSDNGTAALSDLNRITHRAILEQCRVWLDEKEREGAVAAIINAPLLFESGFDRECDLTVAVVAEEPLRILRIMKRDGLSEAAARRRIAAQISDAELSNRADYTIQNDGDEEALALRIAELSDTIKKIAEENPHGK